MDDGSETFLNKMRSDPEWFKDKYIHLMYRPDIDARQSSKKALKEQQKAFKNRELDFYEDWDVEPGAYVIDLYFEIDPPKITFGGLFQVLS